jgi:hypothetical protein
MAWCRVYVGMAKTPAMALSPPEMKLPISAFFSTPAAMSTAFSMLRASGLNPMRACRMGDVIHDGCRHDDKAGTFAAGAGELFGYQRLDRNEARQKYGDVTHTELGPRGGFKSVTYGTTIFGSRRLDPRK